MGHIFDAVPGHVALRVVTVGTAKIESVSLIKTNQVVHEEHPDGDRVICEWEDIGPAPGDFYYVRVQQQQNGHRAWSSPIWTSTTPPRS